MPGGPGCGPALLRKALHMVVPEHEQQGFVQTGDDKVQIVHGKIPGAEDQVYVLEAFLYGGGINQGINLIGNAEDFHNCPPQLPIITENIGVPNLTRTYFIVVYIK
jgi:hypothetical protein